MNRIALKWKNWLARYKKSRNSRSQWLSSIKATREINPHWPPKVKGCNWKGATYECAITRKRVLWVKVRPDYEPQFSILDSLRLGSEQRYWIGRREAEENFCDIEIDTGQVSTGVEIALQMSHNLRFRQEFGQTLPGLSLRAFLAKQSSQAGDCHAARRALAARNDKRLLSLSDLLSEVQPQYLDESRGVRKMRILHLKSEIAQRELSDLGRRSLAL